MRDSFTSIMAVQSSIGIISFFLLVTAVAAASAPEKPDNKFYLMISFGGFRYDYLDMVKRKGRQTPNFDFLINSGVKAEHMRSSFSPSTMPSHWTLATGLNVERHGVVANNFYDFDYRDTYDSRSTPDEKWYNNGTRHEAGEPIWVTYEKSGLGKSGAAVWPASNVPVEGVLPSYSFTQDNEEDIPYEKRIDTVIEWFTLEKVWCRRNYDLFEDKMVLQCLYCQESL